MHKLETIDLVVLILLPTVKLEFTCVDKDSTFWLLAQFISLTFYLFIIQQSYLCLPNFAYQKFLWGNEPRFNFPWIICVALQFTVHKERSLLLELARILYHTYLMGILYGRWYYYFLDHLVTFLYKDISGAKYKGLKGCCL